MIKVNLLPEEVKEEIKQAKNNSSLINIFVKTVFLFLITIVFLGGLYLYYKENLNSSVKILSEKQRLIDQYGNLQENAKKLSERLETIKKIDSNSNKWSGVMVEINKVVPAGIYLTGLKMDSNTKNRSQITGYAITKKEVASLQEALEKSELLEYVDIEGSQTQKDPSSGLDRENFTISLTLSRKALHE